MKFLNLFLICICTLVASNSQATFGGDQTIEVLGYDVKEEKLYILRHFEDERGRLPQLYYYQVNSKTPDKLIEVKSLYINHKTQKIDFDQDGIQFEKDLTKVRERLIPLAKENITYTKLQTIENKVYEVPAWHTLSEKIPLYITTYKVQANNFQSNNQTALNYDNKVKVTQSYIVPNQYKMLVIVKYFGIPIETGYNIEDPVLMLPKKEVPNK